MDEEPLDLTQLSFDEGSEFPTPKPDPESDPAPPDFKASRERPSFRDAMLSGTKTKRKPAGDKAYSKPKKPTPPKRKGQFVEPLTQIYVGVSMVLMPVDPICANAIAQCAEQAAIAWDELAYQNDAVRRALFALTTTSVTTKVIIANLPIITAIIMHHVPAAQRIMGNMGAKMAEQIANQMNANNPPEAPE